MLVFYDHMVLEGETISHGSHPFSHIIQESFFPDDHFQDIINMEAKENTTAGCDALLGNKAPV